MLDHVSFGVRDIPAARRFYDAALTPLGYRCLASGDDYLGYGDAHPAFWLSPTEHPVPEDSRSGLHLCFVAPTRAAVDKFHAAALAAGGRDNGKPGLRPDYGANYYGAFIIDPDGYRIEAHCGASA
jgi:catechol 2,3-dioxygenase-like lactoylglutathione lyase family enzyme